MLYLSMTDYHNDCIVIIHLLLMNWNYVYVHYHL